MALKDFVPGPPNLHHKQIRDLADAIDSGTGGISTSFTFGANDLWDNGYWVAQTGYNQHSPLARAVFVTDATSVDIDVYASDSTSSSAAVQVWVNGTVYASPGLTPTTGAHAETLTQSLPSGRKLIFITGGTNSMSSGVIVGIYLVGCVFNTAAMRLPPEAPARLLVYGDSTSQGGGGGSTGKNIDTAWPNMLRKMTTRSVTIEAASGRTLWDDTNTSGLRAAFVAKLVAMKPFAMWFLIGVNDYAASLWSAVNFGTAYAATLDDIHTALPLIKIYCQTPFFKESEVANSFGDLLEAYREQIRTITRNRSSWAVLVEGTAVLSRGEMLSESSTYLHPNDAGNAMQAQAVEQILNGSFPYAYEANYGVEEGVSWTGTTNVTPAVPSGIQKTGGTDGAADAGGSSTKAIAGPGIWKVRCGVLETNKLRVFGVSSVNTGTALADIRYGFNFGADAVTRLWLDGGGYATGGQTYSAGDVYQLRSDGNWVYYERIRSGIVTILRKASTALLPSVYPLYVHAVILGSSGTITDARIYGILV
jgi:hypothetical protein